MTVGAELDQTTRNEIAFSTYRVRFLVVNGGEDVFELSNGYPCRVEIAIHDTQTGLVGRLAFKLIFKPLG